MRSPGRVPGLRYKSASAAASVPTAVSRRAHVVVGIARCWARGFEGPANTVELGPVTTREFSRGAHRRDRLAQCGVRRGAPPRQHIEDGNAEPQGHARSCTLEREKKLLVAWPPSGRARRTLKERECFVEARYDGARVVEGPQPRVERERLDDRSGVEVSVHPGCHVTHQRLAEHLPHARQRENDRLTTTKAQIVGVGMELRHERGAHALVGRGSCADGVQSANGKKLQRGCAGRLVGGEPSQGECRGVGPRTTSAARDRKRLGQRDIHSGPREVRPSRKKVEESIAAVGNGVVERTNERVGGNVEGHRESGA